MVISVHSPAGPATEVESYIVADDVTVVMRPVNGPGYSSLVRLRESMRRLLGVVRGIRFPTAGGRLGLSDPRWRW